MKLFKQHFLEHRKNCVPMQGTKLAIFLRMFLQLSFLIETLIEEKKPVVMGDKRKVDEFDCREKLLL